MKEKKAEQDTTAVVKAAPDAIVIRQQHDAPAVADMTRGVGLLPVEQQEIALAEYDKRRSYFRKWLLSHLREGVHYGFPPGCEAKYDESGNILQWNQKSGKWTPINPKQWQAKPSLYKAGALYLVELLRLRDTYTSDEGAWRMAGEPKGTFFRTCRLVNPATGDVLGEGTGAFKSGSKGMEDNSAIKMADKRAVVAAVINTIAVAADLFTQDIEDKPQPKVTPGIQNPTEFPALLAAWVESSGIPHAPNQAECDRVRAQMIVWCRGNIPANAQAAMDWLKNNAEVIAISNAEGAVIGIKVQRKESDHGANN